MRYQNQCRSVVLGSIECMFGDVPEGDLIDVMGEATRDESTAIAQRLAAMGELYARRALQWAERNLWTERRSVMTDEFRGYFSSMSLRERWRVVRGEMLAGLYAKLQLHIDDGSFWEMDAAGPRRTGRAAGRCVRVRGEAVGGVLRRLARRRMRSASRRRRGLPPSACVVRSRSSCSEMLL